MSGILSCGSFLEGHPSHFMDALFFEFKGQRKVIAVVRSILDVAGYVARKQKRTKKNIDFANNLFGDVKTVINVANTPHKTTSWCKKYRRTYKSYQALKQKDHHNNSDKWLKAANRSLGLVKETVSIAGFTFFKPIQLAGKFIDIRGDKKLAETWQILSMVKSGLKISCNTGKLYLGTKKPVKKIIDTALEAWWLSYSLLRYNQVYIHPVADITLSVFQSFFSLAETWMKTA